MTTTKATLHLVFTRDEGCCARCGKPITGERGRDWSVHHRTPRARVLLTDDGGFEPVIEMLAAELWHAFGHTKGET